MEDALASRTLALMSKSRNAARDEAPVAGLPARKVAHEAVARLLGKARGLALDDALAETGRALVGEPADRALARAIATATFRHLGLIRLALSERLPQGWPEAQPRLAALLATGSAQILDLNVPDHAAVDLSVRLAKSDPQLRHVSGLVNAVLRRIAREREAILARLDDPLATNTPDWLAVRWRENYGDETARRIARAHLSGAAIDLTMRGASAEMADRVGARPNGLGGLRLTDRHAPIAELPGYEEGAFWVQDAAAALPARLLGARPGERIADLCAAPGGKTAQLCAAGAEVVAVDRSAARLERLEANLRRLSMTAEIRAVDALDLPEDRPFDAVLLDAPCSATGTMRRHPDVAWSKTEGDVGRLAQLQARLLDKAARLVRPGGRLVYCTCSLEPEEGNAQVAAFLSRNPDYERLVVRPDEVGDHAELVDPQGDLRTLPCHLDGDRTGGQGGLDGFFASRLRRLG